MFDKVKNFTLPHLIGFGLIIAGWHICIINMGMDRFTGVGIYSRTNLIGLGIIILGAYFPEMWNSMFGKRE
jgi:hypothetical protein